MSNYRRDDVSSEREPAPHELSGEAADKQEFGFHQRATKPIVWQIVRGTVALCSSHG